MAGFFYKGILLQQRKEPALSRDLHEFLNADTMGLRMDCPVVDAPDTLTYQEIIAIAKQANVIDERDGEPLASKLSIARKQQVRLIVVDAVDDEPFISSQLNPLMKNLELAGQGVRFCQKACEAPQAYFTVYKNLTDLDVRTPRHIGDFTVVRLRGRYPAEYQASQKYAEQEDVLVVGSCAVIHLARAILQRKPQTTAFITVAGDCVSHPANLEVSLGMTVTQVLERCGLIDDPHRVVVGGSMTGISVMDTDKTLVTPTTRAVLAFRKNIKTLGLSCIGCARCVHVCPEGLNPFYLYKSIKENRFDAFHKLDAQLCVGCGTCSYMCPAKLDLSAAIYQGVSAFRPHVSATHKTAFLDKKRDEADFQRFLEDYMLGKATFAHRVTRWKISHKLSQTCKEAMTARLAAIKQSRTDLREAQKNHRAALGQAKAQMNAAKQAMDAAVSDGERRLKQQKKTVGKVVRDVQVQMRASQVAGHAAEVSARQNLLAVEQHQIRLADSVVFAAGEKSRRLEATISATELGTLRSECEALVGQAQARCKDMCTRARQGTARAIEHARATYDYAASLCQSKLAEQKENYAQAQKDAQSQKEAASQAYQLAQEAYVRATVEADAQLAARQAEIVETLVQCGHVWAAAVVQSCPEAIEQMREADRFLCEARERALMSALESAQADAAVTNRAIRAQDFRAPIRLAKCEKELLLGRQLWAMEKGALPAVQGDFGTNSMLLTWVREHGLEDQAAQTPSEEEVFV